MIVSTLLTQAGPVKFTESGGLNALLLVSAITAVDTTSLSVHVLSMSEPKALVLTGVLGGLRQSLKKLSQVHLNHSDAQHLHSSMLMEQISISRLKSLLT